MKHFTFLARIGSIIFFIFSYISMGKAQVLEVTYFPVPESKEDKRFDYATLLLEKALQKTVKDHGPFKMKPGAEMNVSRGFQFLAEGKEVNVGWSTPTIEREEKYIPIRFPIKKGILGFRVFLINRQDRAKFAAISTLKELKSFKVGQGHVWNDVKVFDASGFKVVTGSDYEGLFKMLTAGRFDFFSRGIDEAQHEYAERKYVLPSLFLEETILLYYPWPKYFFTSKKTPEVAKRIERGLLMMMQDGSYDEHFNQFYGKIIEQMNIKNRKLFTLYNPLLPLTAPIDQKELWFNPFEN